MKTQKAPRAPSQRQLRVGEVIRHALAEILQRGDVHDPVLEANVVTVPEVRVAPDLKCATVYVMPLGGKNSEEIVAAFDRNKNYLRTEVARRVNLRSAPDLRFRVDTSFDEGARIDAMLRSPDVVRDLDSDAVNGEPVNGKHVNGKHLNGKAINGHDVNGHGAASSAPDAANSNDAPAKDTPRH